MQSIKPALAVKKVDEARSAAATTITGMKTLPQSSTDSAADSCESAGKDGRTEGPCDRSTDPMPKRQLRGLLPYEVTLGRTRTLTGIPLCCRSVTRGSGTTSSRATSSSTR